MDGANEAVNVVHMRATWTRGVIFAIMGFCPLSMSNTPLDFTALVERDALLAKDAYTHARLVQENPKKAQALFEASHKAVLERACAMPTNLLETLPKGLPVVQRADEIIACIKTNQIVIIAGETGSGKTTQLGKLALLAGQGARGTIGHTQPRRLGARTVGTRIAQELGEPLGKTVAVKMRFFDQGALHPILKLMTDGVLLAELARDRYLRQYDTLIIDEAHERSLNIDFILGYLKQLLPKRPDLKVIITSATLDTERFSSYFDGAPVLNVSGRSHPVEIRYRGLGDVDEEAGVEDALSRGILSAVAECHAHAKTQGRPQDADILIFLATGAQISETQHLLEAAGIDADILPLFARQTHAEQERVFGTRRSKRRIVLATNVAETAVTVPHIRYVIDLGTARIARYSTHSGILRLPVLPISQAAANQRAGRCGRIASGVCIRLYDEVDFLSRPPFDTPEILRTSLASVILQMAHLGLGAPEHFDFITMPDPRQVREGRKTLERLGALDGKRLSRIGKQMARLPLDPNLARILIEANAKWCLADVLVIVAGLMVMDVRERPAERAATADQKHALFKQKDSDFLGYLAIYQAVFESGLSGNERRRFAKAHFLNYNRLNEWARTVNQLLEMTKRLFGQSAKQGPRYLALLDAKEVVDVDPKTRIHIKKTQHDPVLVHYAHLHQALLVGFLPYVAEHSSKEAGTYLLGRGQKARIFPASVLRRARPKWIFAFEVVETSQNFMRVCAKIEPEWLLSVAPHLLKTHYFEPHWRKKSGRVMAYVQISLFGLVVVHKMLAEYESQDLIKAREVFIDEALVQNNYGRELEFLTHNTQMLKDAIRLEDKLRRRDLVVDDRLLFDFYDARLPKHIASRTALMHYLADDANEKALYFTQDDVLRDHPNAAHLGDTWQVGDLCLPVTYVFDPSSEKDGVNVHIPRAALSQLDAGLALWGHRAHRHALVTELLRNLPKEIRKKTAPAADTATRLLTLMDDGRDFESELVNALARIGIVIDKNMLDFDSLSPYLRPLFVVTDGTKTQMSRDVKTLVAQNAPKIIERTHDFEPDTAYHFMHVRHIKGVALLEYQAWQCPAYLHAHQKNAQKRLDLGVYTDLVPAVSAHQTGVIYLLEQALGARKKQACGQISQVLKLAFAPLGDLSALKERLIYASLVGALECYGPSYKTASTHSMLARLKGRVHQKTLEHLPLTVSQLETTKEAVLPKFLGVAQEVLHTLTHIYTRWQHIRGRLLMLDSELYLESIEDIEDQLDDLNLSGFVFATPYVFWQEYPRYLEALLIRLERLEGNQDADLSAVEALDEPMERVGMIGEDWHYLPYRLMLEELRINLFAQPMKTKMAASPKRLQKLWTKLKSSV